VKWTEIENMNDTDTLPVTKCECAEPLYLLLCTHVRIWYSAVPDKIKLG